MNTETPQQLYQKYSDFANAGMKGFPTRDQVYDRITLPPNRAWIKPKKLHPLMVKIAEDAINLPMKQARFQHGRSDDGEFIAFSSINNYEFFRLTVIKTNPKFKTDAFGLWFPGTDGYEPLPSVAAAAASGLIGHFYDALKALQVEGGDVGNDIYHLGTYVESDLSEVSLIKLVFQVGAYWWVLEHRGRYIQPANGARYMALRLFEDLEEGRLQVLTRVVPTGFYQLAFAFYDPGDQGHYGEMIEDDLIFEVIEERGHLPSPSYLASQTDVTRSTLKRLAEDRNYNVNLVAEYLAQYGGLSLVPYLVKDVPDQPFIDINYVDTSNNGLFTVRIYRTK